MTCSLPVRDDDLWGKRAQATSTPHQPATAGFAPVLRLNACAF